MVLLLISLTSAADLVPNASRPLDQRYSAEASRRSIEEDWLRQAEGIQLRGVTKTQKDARGACDGVKDGKYGFHTASEPHPWWQVDLGALETIQRIVLFNRLDYPPGLHNADNLNILVSPNGEEWKLLHEIKGEHFGGMSGAKPYALDLTGKEIQTRFVRLQISSDKPVYFHLDEVEIFGVNKANLALHQTADQSSVSQWSTTKLLGGKGRLKYFPTAQFIQSARRLATLENAKWNGLSELDQVEQRLKSLAENASEEESKNLYLEARWAARRVVLSNPLLDFKQLLFVKRFTQETYPDVCLNHMPWVSRPGGDLCVISHDGWREGAKASGKAEPASSFAKATADRKAGTTYRAILNRALGPGHVHGMDLSWDAKRIVFGYARSRSDEAPAGWKDRAQSYHLRRTEEPIHIYEIGVDGNGLRQLSFGEWSDLDPSYVANGDIVFVSERCGTSLQCNEYDKDETSCNLYIMRPDGRGIRRLTANKDGDYLPHALDDGTIGYTRWEYHERSFAFIQSIWRIRPDGTGADALFKQHFANPWALEDTRSIPGSHKLVSIAAGHHTLAVGPLVVIDPAFGINAPTGISIITPDIQPPEGGMDGARVKEGGVLDGGGFYSTPWPLSEKQFLVSYSYSDEQTEPAGYGLYLVDVFGNKELLYRDPEISCFSPIPLRPRPRPPNLSEQLECAEEAFCILSDAAFGSQNISVELEGEACDLTGRHKPAYIRIAEPVGWPYDNSPGGQRYGEDHRYGGEEADKKNLLSWTPIRVLGDVPLQKDGSAHFTVPADRAVYFQLLDSDRMELRRMRSFISFHPGEIRSCSGCHESRGISPRSESLPLAASYDPVRPTPPPWGDRPINFLRDIQPVLDRNCVSCHRGLRPAGGLDFFAGLTSHDKDVPGYGYNRAYKTIMEKELVAISAVRAQDASITPPLAYGSRKSRLIQALNHKPHAQQARLTEEEKLRLVIWIDANAPYHDRFINKRTESPAYDLANDAHLKKQLAGTHSRRCGHCHNTEEISRLDWIDFRNAGRSLFLSAPLARQWGGTERCRGEVYADTDDPDYVAIHDLVSAAIRKAWARPRRDLQGLIEEQKLQCLGPSEEPAKARTTYGP